MKFMISNAIGMFTLLALFDGACLMAESPRASHPKKTHAAEIVSFDMALEMLKAIEKDQQRMALFFRYLQQAQPRFLDLQYHAEPGQVLRDLYERFFGKLAERKK